MNYLFNALQAVFEGFMGGFRGGQYLPTNHTFITRMLWAIALAVPMLLHGWSWIPVAIMVPIFYMTMLWISHVPFQNMRNIGEWLGMFGIGVARGAVYAAVLYYWFHLQVLYLIPLTGSSQVLSYLIGKYSPVDPGTQPAEIINNVGYWAIFSFFTLLPAIG